MMGKIIKDRDTIEGIIRGAQVCRIGLCDDGQPYVVPVSFGYADGVLYFHSAPRGRKLEVLRKNAAVCCEFDVDVEIVRDGDACDWSVRYRSAIGFGKASIVEEPEEKRRALDAIVAHYGGQPQDYPDDTLRRTAVVKVEIETWTGKTSGY
jgi:hypothetical protein